MEEIQELYQENYHLQSVSPCINKGDPDKYFEKTESKERVYKLRWNQVGGPEILTIENHQGDGCNIVFNDLHVEFVMADGLDELKWKVEEGEK